jgi:hypothetical protein
MTRPLSPQLSDDSTSTGPLTGSFSQLTDDFVAAVLKLMNKEKILTIELVENANAQLLVFENVPMEHRIVGSGTTRIDSLKVLREMLNNAPTGRGKRYVTCTVIYCDSHEEDLVGLASDWVNFLLWPCTS